MKAIRASSVDPARLLPEAGRIGIVMLSAIGDAVHVLPIINALKRSRPDVRISWIIQSVPYRLVHNHPAVDDFVVFTRLRGLRFWPGYLRTLRAVRREPFDLVLGLQVYLKAGILLAALRSPAKIGFDRRRARDLQWLFSTHRIPPHTPQHVQDQYFEFLDFLHLPRAEVTWNLRLTPAEQREQERFFGAIGRPVCAVVVGTSKSQKNWPVERYARLLEIIESDFALQTVLVGGPSEEERSRAAAIAEQTRAHPRNELGGDLRRLLYLLAGSCLVVSPDTGPLHIARALDVPVIGLYGFTNPKRSGPYRKYGDLIVDGYARFPGEDYPVSMEYRARGMSRITLDMVRAKLEHAQRTYLSGYGRGA
jgi:heptosyltransferase I